LFYRGNGHIGKTKVLPFCGYPKVVVCANNPTESKLCGACKIALDKGVALCYNKAWQFYSKERVWIAI